MSKLEPCGYLGGDIMSFGSNLAREYEYNKFKELNLPVEVYSPVMNKSINDKANMTEEENNHLAEKITKADIDRLWNSDFVVMCPEQSAVGSLTEVGCLFGWKYMADRLMRTAVNIAFENDDINFSKLKDETKVKMFDAIYGELGRIYEKKDFFHYFDIRTNHLNEKDWRRSFSINQLLYGMILYCSNHPEGIQSFESIMEELKELYGKDNGDCGNDI